MLKKIPPVKIQAVKNHDFHNKQSYSSLAGLLFEANKSNTNLPLRTASAPVINPLFSHNTQSNHNSAEFSTHIILKGPYSSDKIDKIKASQLYQQQNPIQKPKRIKSKPRTFFSWCKFQIKGWFNKEKITAEFANLITRTGTYAAMGAAVGAIGGTVFCPGFGTLGGAAGGALAGLICGLIVSAVSIIMKPIMSSITQHLKNRGSDNYVKIIAEMKEPISVECRGSKKAAKLANLLTNCETKMLNFTYDRWLQNKSKSHDAMQTILNECVLSGSLMINILDELCIEFNSNIGEYSQIETNYSKYPKANSQICLERTVNDQSRSYNMVRLQTAVLGSEAPIFSHLHADINATIYFPVVGIVSAVVAGAHGKTMGKVKKVLTHPFMTAANIGVGILATTAEFVPVLDSALNGLHGIGIPSMLFSIGIHYLKEKYLAQKDVAIKIKILDHHSESYDKEEFISKDFARVVRHDVTKNIPTALTKLVDLVKESRKLENYSFEDKAKVAEKFLSTIAFIKQSVDLVNRYCDYSKILCEGDI